MYYIKENEKTEQFNVRLPKSIKSWIIRTAKNHNKTQARILCELIVNRKSPFSPAGGLSPEIIDASLEQQ